MQASVNNKCYHCGGDCGSETHYDNHVFCCNGCKSVYEILHKNNLCQYYEYSEHPGGVRNKLSTTNYSFLDNEEIANSFVKFKDLEKTIINFNIQNVHCISCIWLLENINYLDKYVINSTLDFNTKVLTVAFDNKFTSIRNIAETLDKIGYPPLVNLEQISGKKNQQENNSLLIKIGVAGFCAGNIMMLSIPEYFVTSWKIEPTIKSLFVYLSLFLSIPVIFYCASSYFKNSFKSIKNNFFSFDIPLALGFIFIYARSLYEIFMGIGSGYLDSMSGLIFLLLIGKYMQQKTYTLMSFERDYRSYFPLVAMVCNGEQETAVPVSNLKIGDNIKIRYGELIPADSILIDESVNIDYSFVTGESYTVSKSKGELLYAGGRVVSNSVNLVVSKATSQSYLTQLWNNSGKEESLSSLTSSADKFAKYFTIVLIGIALVAGLAAYSGGAGKVVTVITSVLVIACPCALGIAIPFTFGNVLTLLGRKNIYLKNATIVEKVSETTDIVFDKTGTLTDNTKMRIEYNGENLTEMQKIEICKLVENSLHPISISIKEYLKASVNSNTLTREFRNSDMLNVQAFEEIIGVGLSGTVNNNFVQLISKVSSNKDKEDGSQTVLFINKKQIGIFKAKHIYRDSIFRTIEEINNSFKTHLLSGDNDRDKSMLMKYFDEGRLHFRVSPFKKEEYVKNVSLTNAKVMMIGDGLNDSGALLCANVGVSVTNNESVFTPSSDVICQADSLNFIPRVIELCKKGVLVVRISFVLSILYNIIGLSFAIRGELSPVVAAILMPISSVTVIGISLLGTSYYGRKILT